MQLPLKKTSISYAKLCDKGRAQGAFSGPMGSFTESKVPFSKSFSVSFKILSCFSLA